MATYPVEIPSENRWGVFHSVSGTMFSPTFVDELNAAIFAAYYANNRAGDYEESTQAHLSLNIAVFLDELAPRPKEGQERVLPIEWQQACDPNWEEGEKPHFDAYELLEVFQDQSSRQANFILDAFEAWRAIHHVKSS